MPRKSRKSNFSKRLRDLFPKRGPLIEQDVAIIFGITALYYLYSYLTYPLLPNSPDNGWWGWFDQGRYYEAIKNLAHFQLKPNHYWPGYPLLGAPFYWISKVHPLLFPNLIMVSTMVAAFYSVCKTFFSKAESCILIVFFIFQNSHLWETSWILPWNNIPIACFSYLTIATLAIQKPRLQDFYWISIALLIPMLGRPTDFVIVSILYFFPTLALKTKDRMKAWNYFATSGIVAAILLVLANLYLYGSVSSPYMFGEKTKFSVHNYGVKLYQFLWDGRFLSGDQSINGNSYQLIEQYPIFLLLLPGCYYLWKKRGIQTLGIGMAIAVLIAFYLCFNPFTNVQYFWSYHQWHYVWWSVPWLAFLSYLSIRRAYLEMDKRIFLALALGPVVILLSTGYKAETIACLKSQQEMELNLQSPVNENLHAIKIKALRTIAADNLKIVFKDAPNFGASDVTNLDRMQLSTLTRSGTLIEFNDHANYSASSKDGVFNFSFLAREFTIKKNDVFRIYIKNPTPISIAELCWTRARFSWGAGFRHLLKVLNE